jgi:N-acetylmuramoyl-L-alanine amidase
MATSPSKAEIGLPLELQTAPASPQNSGLGAEEIPASGRDALQALLAFSALHEQVRQRRIREAMLAGSSQSPHNPDQFLLFEVLQLVAERALALTGADGIAIALVHEGDIICRAAAGAMAPDVGAKLDLNAGFSGFCLRTRESVRCDDAEKDARVNQQASHRLKAKSMLAVPLCGRHSVLGLIEAFSSEAYGFSDSDLSSLKLLAELILGAMKPEEQEQLESLSPVAMHGKRLAPEQRPQAAREITLPAPEQQAEPAKESTLFVPERMPLASKENTFPAPERTPALGAAQLDELIRRQVKAATANVSGTVPPTIEETQIPSAELLKTAANEIAPQVASSAPTAENQDEASATAEVVLPTIVRRQGGGYRSFRVVAAVIVVALLCAGALWWRLRTKTAAVAATPAAVASQAPSATPPLTTSTTTPKLDPAAESVPSSVQPTISSGELPGRITGVQPGLLPTITGVRHWESGDSTTVVIDLQDQVQYEVHRLTDPERIYFDLHDTLLASGLSGKTFEVGDSLLVRIRVAQPMPGVSRIVLETKDVSNFSVSLEQNPFRLVASIRKQASDKRLGAKLGMPQNYLQSEAAELKAGTGLPSKEDIQLRARVPHMKIAVDAGHGGWDLGTVGRHGLLEKDLVLDVAQRLGALLERRLGTEVVYTRPEDNYIPLEQRAEMANEAQADLFVSVHANYSDYAFARGVETYYTNFSSSPETADIEKRENATAKAAPLSPSLTGVALKERTEQSRRLASSIERALYGKLAPTSPGLRDRGVKEAGFVVLTGTSMPAVLTEISFVSSPMDEKNLQSASYRQSIAEALYKGIARYAASSSRVKIASAAGKPTGR